MNQILEENTMSEEEWEWSEDEEEEEDWEEDW
jgi:hypothetical protein